MFIYYELINERVDCSRNKCILLPLSAIKVKLSTIKLFFMVPKVSLPVGLVRVACFFFHITFSVIVLFAP